MRFRAISFDCYGTLIDWDRGIGDWLASWARARGLGADVDDLLERFALRQRHHQALPAFKSYRRVLADALGDLARELGATSVPGEAEAFAATAATWPPFADSVAALGELKGQGRVLAVISNVDNDLFAGTRALLGDPFDVVVTAEDVRSYKPAAPHFLALRDALAERGIGEDGILHVARSRFHDIAPANALGWDNCWVDRRHGKAGHGVGLPSEAVPRHRATGMDGVVDLLGGIDPA